MNALGIFLAGFLAASPVLAQGLRVDDLSIIGERVRATLGAGYAVRAERQRLTLHCVSCPERPMLDILLGRQTDGTEARIRDGQTTIAQLEAVCQARAPSCRLERADIGPAVGWMSTYALGENGGATLVLLRDGDLLTLRSIAASTAAARRQVQTLMAEIVPELVGP